MREEQEVVVGWRGDDDADIREEAKATLVVPRDAPFPVARYNALYDTLVRQRREIRAGMRARRLPFVVTATTAGTVVPAWVVEAVTESSGHLFATAGSALLSAAALTAIGVTRVEQLAGWSARYAAAVTGAAGWVAMSATAGPAWWEWSMLALVCGATALGTPWRRAHAADPAPPADEPERPEWSPPALSVRVEDFTRRWTGQVSGG